MGETFNFLFRISHNVFKRAGNRRYVFFGVGLIIKNRLNNEYSTATSNTKLALSLIIPPVTAFLVWIFFSLPHAMEVYGNAHIPSISELVPRLVLWMYHDPILFFLYIPLCVKRAWEIKNKDTITIYDVFAFAGIGFMAPVFILGMGFTYHYLMPVYAVALPFIINILYTQGHIQKIKYKLVGVILIPILMSLVTNGIRYIVLQHYNDKNFTEMITVCKEITSDRQQGQIVRFHFLGAHNSDVDHFMHSFGTFLDKTNVPIKAATVNDQNGYDIASYEKIICTKLPPWLRIADSLGVKTYSYLDPCQKTTHASGDYVVLTPAYDGVIPPGLRLIKKWRSPGQFSISKEMFAWVFRTKHPNRLRSLTLYQIQ